LQMTKFAPGKYLLEENVTFTTGSPLHFENWSRIARRNPSETLRMALLSGAAISTSSKVVLADSFRGGCSLCEAYGSTECGVLTLSGDISNEGVGYEPPGIPRIKLHPKTNEILVNPSSPMFMNGYVLATAYNKDDYFSDGWFRTGDVGRRDEKGNVHLLGRVDDRIGLPNGHDLYPAEVETVLAQVIPDRQIFVTFINNQLIGILTGERSETVVKSLETHARENLAPSKQPERYVFVSQVPVTATNKVKRRELSEIVSRL